MNSSLKPKPERNTQPKLSSLLASAVPFAGGAIADESDVAVPKVADLTRGKTADDAVYVYDRGYRLFWDGHPAEALAHLTAATQLDGGDARFWYYKWLAERAVGATGADASLRTALRLHADAGNTESINFALSRIQGPVRDQIENARWYKN